MEPIQAPARIVIPVTFGNTLDGRSHGVEVTADARPFTRWRWTANYSYGRIQLSRQEGSLDGSQERRNEGSSPRHQIQLTSSTHVGGRWSIDAFARYVSPLAEGPVPAYWTTNVRAAWAMSSELELSVVAHDLNQPHHAEWPGAIEIERGAYVRLAWSR